MDNVLHLGVSKKDITPKVGCRLYGYRPNFYSEKLHDGLEAVALVFEKNGLKCAIVSATVVAIGKSISDKIKKSVEEKTDIKGENILICCTHTHTGPATRGGDTGWGGYDVEYIDGIFIPQIIAAIEEANTSLVPVKLGVGKGISHVGINRREFDENNMARLGQREWGVFNPIMTILSFKDYDGNVVANIIHYGCHATAGGHVLEISRDWPGVMTDRLQAVSGGITAFINGPEGDVGPRITNGKTVGHDVSYIEEHGAVAAADAVRIFNTIKAYDTGVRLDACNKTIKIPVKPRMDLELAKNKLAEYESGAQLVNINQLIKVFYEKTVSSYADGYEEVQHREFDMPAVRIGNAVIVGYGYELFSEIGLRIRDMVKDADVLPVINVNDSEGYLPTQSELVYGGYEVNHFKYSNIQPYVDNADWYFITETIKNLEDMLCTE